MSGNSYYFYTFFFLIILFFVSTASAEDIHIVDMYSDIDSADVTIHAGEHYTGITINADLIFGEKVLVSKKMTVDDISANTDITKILSWDIKNPKEGFYRTRMTLSKNGDVLETGYYNFSYGWQALPRIFIKDIIPDSRGISVILAPSISQFGSSPTLTDVEYMLVDGDTVIYRITDSRITVVQATPLSKDWTVVLQNNHPYSVRIKARIYSGQTSTIAQSKDFVAMDDARITELYRDGTGASVTVMGHSQVPFEGNVLFTIQKDDSIIEEIREKSPILMSGDDETVEVEWSRRLARGVYGLSVRVMGNDNDIVDRWETIIEVEQTAGGDEQSTPEPTQTPGFVTWQAGLLFSIIYLLIRKADRRNG